MKTVFLAPVLKKNQYTMPASSDRALAIVAEAERQSLASGPQLDLETTHNLYAGIYSRTVRIPAGVVITGATIKIPTVLTIVGNMILNVGDKAYEITGVTTFNAKAPRKQIMFAKTDCVVTMAFATKARTIEEAEAEFTDEVDALLSRKKEKKQ